MDDWPRPGHSRCGSIISVIILLEHSRNKIAIILQREDKTLNPRAQTVTGDLEPCCMEMCWIIRICMLS